MKIKSNGKIDVVSKSIDPIWDSGHGKPTTRRQALSRGFISGSSLLFVPSIFSIAASKVYGQEANKCGPAGAAGAAGAIPGRLGFLQFDFAGGWLPAKHFVVTGTGGPTDYLSDGGAATLGIPADQNPANDPANIDNELGIPMLASSSFLMGIRSKASATTLANVNGRILCVRSRDDSRNPEWGDIVHNILRTGQSGSLVEYTGTGNNGGRYNISNAAMASVTPVRIRSGNDARGIVNTGLIGEVLTDDGQAERLLRGMLNTSQAKLNTLLAQNIEDQYKTLVECSYMNSIGNLTNFTEDGIDPGNDPLVQQVLQANNINGDNRISNAFNLNDGDDERTVTNAKLVLDGYSGCSTIEIGGHDNHGRKRKEHKRRKPLSRTHP